MNKTAIKNYAIWARVNLIEAAKQRAYQYEITKDSITDANADVVSGKPLTKEEKEQRRQLIDRINRKGFDQVMEEVAYTWFNRFIALRFMEVNGYLPTKIRVFTDFEGNFKPEILKEALTVELPVDKAQVMELLEKQDNEELYKMLLIAQCNELSNGLPDMFEVISNYTELLFPNNLLKEDSVLGEMVNTIPEEDWTDAVQIIGWLYQYYNTELNDLVYDGTMSKSRVGKELLPAATTIYTPDWAVRYMIENSLGRLWYEGHPNTEIKKEWKYYLDEAQQEPEVEEQLKAIREEYKTIRPEDIKVIDPCMGSGHILVYAFDVLMQIYTSAGWSERDAAESILENNLYGLDIDDRAGQLAYFAVMMKARKYSRRILTKNIRPKVFSIQESNNVKIEAWWRLGPEEDIARRLVQDLTDAKEYGSILNLSVSTTELQSLRKRLDDIEEMSDQGNLLDVIQSDEITRQLYPLVELAEVMVQKYDVVVTNPPYLGNSRFSPKLDGYIKENYNDVKSDLSMVMYKHAIDSVSKHKGFIAFITTTSWMYISSFEKLRCYVQSNCSINSLVDFGTELFEGKVGHNPIVAWITFNMKLNYRLTGVRLVDYCYSKRDEKVSGYFNPDNRYTSFHDDFTKIPGSPIAYWVSENFIKMFENKTIGDYGDVITGMTIGDNNLYLRLWYEVNSLTINFDKSTMKDIQVEKNKWIPYSKGGPRRNWYGNYEYVVNWSKKDNFNRSKTTLQHLYLQEAVTWPFVTSGDFSARLLTKGFLWDVAGSPCFFQDKELELYILGFMASKICNNILKITNPTINVQAVDVARLPLIIDDKEQVVTLVNECINNSQIDWDAYEPSWNFKKNPLI